MLTQRFLIEAFAVAVTVEKLDWWKYWGNIAVGVEQCW